MLRLNCVKIGKCGALLFAILLVSSVLVSPAQAEWSFIRGDGNGDGNADIADAIFGLNQLFLGGPSPCFDALDVNDDGAVDIADPIFLLDVLFGSGGSTPPAPFPTCGTDPTADAIDCAGPLTGCPEVSPSCVDDSDCPTGEFCNFAIGTCGSSGPGNCFVIPFACPAHFDPVCGCDGLTYGNICEAQAAGVSVDFEGQCTATCNNNGSCPAGEFCQKALGNCSGAGTCTAIPFVCTTIFDPVCGCDGVTYPNECVAWSNGVNADTSGACPGCTDNTQCAAGEFCQKALGDCAGTGTCAPIPFICTAIFAPVCGCDGNTYSNECVGWSNGVSAASNGACVAGCTDNSACAAGEFCQKAIGNCAGTGTCAPIPLICTAIFAPVCGCDGNTYSNECVGWSNGVSADFSGMCP